MSEITVLNLFIFSEKGACRVEKFAIPTIILHYCLIVKHCVFYYFQFILAPCNELITELDPKSSCV